MMGFAVKIYVLSIVFAVFVRSELITDEDAARAWLVEYNKGAEKAYYDSVSASWTYNTNLTDYNLQLEVGISYFE